MVTDLRTIKKIIEITGISLSFLNQLIAEGRLTKYQINTVNFIDLLELNSIAKPVSKAKITEELKKKIETL